MSGEIKITVIATGFDIDKIPRPGLEKMTAAAEMSALTSIKEGLAGEGEEDEKLEDELEVPAFIRRKLKWFKKYFPKTDRKH